MKKHSLIGVCVFLFAAFIIHEYFNSLKLRSRDERIKELEYTVWEMKTTKYTDSIATAAKKYADSILLSIR